MALYTTHTNHVILLQPLVKKKKKIEFEIFIHKEHFIRFDALETLEPIRINGDSVKITHEWKVETDSGPAPLYAEDAFKTRVYIAPNNRSLRSKRSRKPPHTSII